MSKLSVYLSTLRLREVRPALGDQLMAGAQLLVTVIALGVLAVGAPFVTCLAIWWSRNWGAIRMAEAMPASGDAKERTALTYSI